MTVADYYKPDFQVFADAAARDPRDGRTSGVASVPVHETKHPHRGPEYNDWVIAPEALSLAEEDRRIFEPERILSGSREISDFESSRLEEIRRRISVEIARVVLLGSYTAKSRDIDLYECEPELRIVVTVHERMHAIHHLLPDRDGQCWHGFSKASRAHKELLAQLFTYKYFEKRRDTRSLFAMSDLARRQSSIYSTYQLISNWDDASCVRLYWHIRKNLGSLGILDDLLAAAEGGKPMKPKHRDLAPCTLTEPVLVAEHVLLKRSSLKATGRGCFVPEDGEIVVPASKLASRIDEGTTGILIDDRGRIESRVEFISPCVPYMPRANHMSASFRTVTSWEFRAKLETVKFVDPAPTCGVGVNGMSHAALSAIVAAADLHEMWANSITKRVIEEL